ncbi:MAG: quinolinate synthase NadA [Chitinivibrionales bacterium]|nr:quinolinate synthase NadA [Chitinivibrionales bacterium]
MSTITDRIRELKQQRQAVILAHTYQPGDVQDIADFVGDSYGLSVEASRVESDCIVFCGVLFMAETAAILNPTRTVLIPEPTAGCPMADMIEPSELEELRRQYPDHLVMCYVNSTAEIKALSDVCCTSANALTIAGKLPADRGIIFVPDKHLGDHIAEQTGREMVLWKGFCPTHVRIAEQMLHDARRRHPGAPIMIHPEAPRPCRHLADQVLSTGGMCRFVADDPHEEYVVATEVGIIHTLQKRNPQKRFHPLDKAITCPNMKLGSLESVLRALEGSGGMEVSVPPAVAEKARTSLEKMLEMSR